MLQEITASITTILTLIFDAKWKVIAFIILAILGFSGSLIWDSKDVLVGIWARQPVVIDVEKYEEWAPKLVKRHGASGTILLDVSVERNERSVLYFSTVKSGRLKEYEGFKAVLLSHGSQAHDANAVATAKLMTKHAFCDDNPLPVTVFGQVRKKEGIVVLCKAPIFDNDKLIGVVELGFEKMPEDPQIVIDNLRVVAQQIKK